MNGFGFDNPNVYYAVCTFDMKEFLERKEWLEREEADAIWMENYNQLKAFLKDK